ncbi:ParA family protein [Jiulongibacter sediminis]|jgi:chromosome partitioning protein|uniref:CobQ/CobB/MinD/ParA nucleotide binding domain-containing protein n=1 Tax=Jiulongibacter sediminis TaxID=1605367 RepID=A0A0P7CAT2_9BACT|nr:ParA family protein [Jiulongibacter sediminis]KPM49811.1 hypothetical protein AFM12_04350 [Jiulongibacter sediminis]TBX26848.1 hypothetical protein TK44_04355 [Jiulongibacter sediminis]
MGKIYIIANGARQSGKSTTSLNLALCFATLTQKTLLIDLDPGKWMEGLCSQSKKGRINLNSFLTFQNAGEIDQESLDLFDKIVIDCPAHKMGEIFKALSALAEVLIPVECEFYGLNELPDVLRLVDAVKIKTCGFLPVMYKPDSETSEAVLKELKLNFGDLVLPAIQRNYYLARQKDFKKVVLSELTQRAAVTYLSVANQLL